MVGRDPQDRGRSATPLELLYDLTYVVGFAAAAEELAHAVSHGEVASGLAAYAFAIFSLSWAWMNFTWFSSAFGNDDALFRVATIVQMAGVVVLIFGLPVTFEETAHGESPHNGLVLVGYVVMRVPLVALWLRAARHDPARRSTAVAYAVLISLALAGWVCIVLLPLPTLAAALALVVLALVEMVAPVVLERRLGWAPWNPTHIAERFSLLTIIVIGEVVAATTAAVGALTRADGWSAAAAVIIGAGLLTAAALWWAYFLIPSGAILEQWPERTFAWRYAHLPIFGSIAAVGAGLRVAATAVEDRHLSLLDVTLALVVPVAAVLLTIFATWSVLMHAYDLTHVPLFLAALVPLVVAVVVAGAADDGHLQVAHDGDLVLLVVVLSLVALSAVVEVVGHEMVGFRHTVRVVEGPPRRMTRRSWRRR